MKYLNSELEMFCNYNGAVGWRCDYCRWLLTLSFAIMFQLLPFCPAMYEERSNGMLEVVIPWYAGAWRCAFASGDVRLFACWEKNAVQVITLYKTLTVVCNVIVPSTEKYKNNVAVPLVDVAMLGFSRLESNND